MVKRPSDDVGHPIPGLPDFVDPADVRDASLDASTAWGSDAPAKPPVGLRDGGNGTDAVASDGRSPGTRGRSRGGSSFGDRRSSGGFGSGKARSGKAKKQKPFVSWEEKRARKEKRLEKRAAAEAEEREKDPLGFAREIVLRQLTAAPRSRGWLEDKLREKDVEPDVIEAVLDRMEDVGLVDDVEYAGMLVRSQVASRGLARKALAQELRRKGVQPDAAEEALAQVTDDDERDRAYELATKKMRTMSSLAPEVQTRRLAGLLARKGYPPGIVWSVIKEVQADADMDPAHDPMGDPVADPVTDPMEGDTL